MSQLEPAQNSEFELLVRFAFGPERLRTHSTTDDLLSPTATMTVNRCYFRQIYDYCRTCVEFTVRLNVRNADLQEYSRTPCSTIIASVSDCQDGTLHHNAGRAVPFVCCCWMSATCPWKCNSLLYTKSQCDQISVAVVEASIRTSETTPLMPEGQYSYAVSVSLQQNDAVGHFSRCDVRFIDCTGRAKNGASSVNHSLY